MKLALCVHREGAGARAAAVAFDDWDAAEPLRSWTAAVADIGPAERGQADLRDLPCLLQLMHANALQPELVVIDGCVHLDAQETPALGLHLFHALGGRIPVIGVSKSALPGLPAQFEVQREAESRPLWLTCVGIDLGAAKARLRAMHGRRRVPTLLKWVARLAKSPPA